MEELNNQEYAYINEDYRITSDGSRNLVLQRKYEKRDGKGKNAPMSGSFDYKVSGSFGANLDALIRLFKDEEFLGDFKDVQRGQDIVDVLNEVKELMITQHKELLDVIRPTIKLELKNVKDLTAKEEDIKEDAK